MITSCNEVIFKMSTGVNRKSNICLCGCKYYFIVNCEYIIMEAGHCFCDWFNLRYYTFHLALRYAFFILIFLSIYQSLTEI
jgi:hypothetical protein